MLNYVLYGVKYIGLVSLAMTQRPNTAYTALSEHAGPLPYILHGTYYSKDWGRGP